MQILFGRTKGMAFATVVGLASAFTTGRRTIQEPTLRPTLGNVQGHALSSIPLNSMARGPREDRLSAFQ